MKSSTLPSCCLVVTLHCDTLLDLFAVVFGGDAEQATAQFNAQCDSNHFESTPEIARQKAVKQMLSRLAAN